MEGTLNLRLRVCKSSAPFGNDTQMKPTGVNVTSAISKGNINEKINTADSNEGHQ